MTLRAVKGGWVREMKTAVHHWRFEDGKTCPNPTIPEGRGRLDAPPRGWYCWVYPADDQEYVEWMAKMCPTADVCHRFNSGNPMYTTYISDDTEATLFRLRWM
jgi:hypothetical protein